MPPRLSVIMPIFNGARTLERSLRSMLGNDADAIEIIAVDQASSDGSRDILERYRKTLPLRIIDNPQGRSWIENTNLGIREASGDLVTMLHQDDLWYGGRVKALLRLADTFPEAGLIVHRARLVDECDRTIGTMSPPFGPVERLVEPTEALVSLLVQNTIALPAAAFRREAYYDAGGLRADLWHTADWDLWLKLARASPLAWCPDRLAAFRIHVHSLTMRGSADLGDYRAQLTIPVEAHLDALPKPEREGARRLAETSRELNVWLAGRYHHEPVAFRPVARQLMRLGIFNWPALLTRTQFLARVVPRLRLLLRMNGR